VSEWHVHDAIWDRGTHPPALLDDLEDRFGKRPYDRCDTNHTDSEDSLRSFAAMLRREMSIKISMVEHLMTTRPWDLCAVGISQGHCAGHQMWHLHDAARAGTAPGKVAHDLVTDTYEAIDAALGRLVAAAGPDCGVVVLTSHGMESYVAGPQFLQPLLESWGFHRPDARRALLRRIVPKDLMGRLFRAAPALQRAAADRGAWTDRLSGTTTAIAVPNNRVGAIRLNVEGREPHGTVTDVDAALTDLENRLAALRHAATDEPIVDHTIRPFETYGPDAHPDLPDLLVVFRQDLGELNDIVCPEAGRLSIGVRRPDYQRTGDHTDRSHIWIDHPDVGGIEQFRSEDVAPTLLALLGVALPDDLDGRVGVKMSSGSSP
jgi:predicted AlkP superfamily phosphohydrolase/phosphomutase